MSAQEFQHNQVIETGKYDVIGTRPVRHDGADKVTGRAKYGADYAPPDALHGKILRSPYSHAIIKSIDTSKAQHLPGVKAVVTSEDLPSSNGDRELSYRRENILASSKVLYKGHAIAAIAAVSPHVAEEALAMIEVQYDVLPPVLTAPEGMSKEAPILHSDLKTVDMDEQTDTISNVAERTYHKMGDIGKGFSEADVIVEGEYDFQTVHQGYIEPQPCTTLWNEDGRITIWCSTQGGFLVRDFTADRLGVPVSQIKVVPMEIGGGFGGKTEIYLEPVSALLSKKTGRPVKMVMTRQEVFEATGPTPGAHLKVRMGATKSGKIVAADASMAFEAGAFPGSCLFCANQTVFGAYNIPNVAIESFDVVVNKPKAAAFRAPLAPNAVFAADQLVDELCEKLGMDPIDLRLINAAKEGTRRAFGPVFPRIGCIETLEAMKAHPHYTAPLEGPNRGRGIAIGFWFNIGEPSAVTISVNSDGTVNLMSGSPDIGGTRASLAMQAAEVLGIAADQVNPSVGDTDSIGYTAQTDGSRVTFATGWAAYEAAHDVKRQMIERAATIWETPSDTIEMQKGIIRSKTNTELSMTFSELSGRLRDTGGPIVGRATVDPKGIGGSVAGNIVDVEVDPETGKVDIIRFTAFQDAGKAIHPSYVEGQMQGGSVQGIGWALNEEYFMDDSGQMMNSSLLDYRMPTILDLPMIDTVIIEVPNPGHPFGVRGVGEASIIPPTPAIANAINNAIGVRLRKLPMNPGAIMEAIWQKK